MEILHLIPSLTLGGASRAMIALVKSLSRYQSIQQSIISLQPIAPPALTLASTQGIKTIHDRLSQAALHQAIEQVDIVHIHFWNHPRIYQFLQSQLPASRIVVWCHIGGASLPQVITPDIIEFSDYFVGTSPYSLEKLNDTDWYQHPLISQVKVIPPFTNIDRLLPIHRQDHTSFNVGYIGTTTSNKMHPRFVPMSAEIRLPSIQFIVCGGDSGCQALQRQAFKLGVADKFTFKGYVEDVKSVLETLDVFGYPLCPDNYSTTELVLQEAMLAGIPPVVFDYGGASRTVIHGETGLIVKSEADYQAAIEYLYHYSQERVRLGNQARHYVQEHFSSAHLTQAWIQLYEQLVQQPKRYRQLYSEEVTGGGNAFVRSLGSQGIPFRLSAESEDIDELMAMDEKIARSSPALCDRRGGGLLHYQEVYRTDPYLQFWVGLTFQHQGDNIRAIASFTQAKKLGFPHGRINGYLLRSATAINKGLSVL